MKKRIIAMSVIFALLLSTLLGCGIIVKNQERDYNQVVATVGYDSAAANADYISRQMNDLKWDSATKHFTYSEGKKKILKRDLMTFFINNGQSYMSSYGWTVAQAFEEMLNILIQRETVVQEAIRTLYAELPEEDRGDTRTLEGCLTDAEIRELEATVYNSYYDQIKKLKDEIDEEQGLVSPSPSADSSPSATPTPRPTQGPVTSPSPSPVETKEPIPDEGNWLGAVKRFENMLKQNDSTLTKEKYYAQQLSSQMETKVLEKYQKHVENRAVADPETGFTWANLVNRYNTMLDQQKEQYGNDKASFVSALEGYTGSSFLLYSPVDGYFYVKSLLVGLSDAQNNKIMEIDAKGWSEEKTKAEKQKVLNQIIAEDLRDIVTYTKDKEAPNGEKMEVVDFNKVSPWLPYTGKKVVKDGKVEEDETLSTYQKFLLDGLTAAGTYGGGAGSFVNQIKSEIASVKGNADFLNADIYDKSKTPSENAFANLIFKYGTDPGMFNNAVDYLVGKKPDPGVSEKFVTEFADGSRLAQKDYQTAIAGGKSQEESQIASMRIVATQYGWHILMVTDEVPVGEQYQLNQTDLDNGITTSFTYKLAEALKTEIKTDAFNDEWTKLNDKYGKLAGFVTKYEKAYKDLLKLK